MTDFKHELATMPGRTILGGSPSSTINTSTLIPFDF